MIVRAPALVSAEASLPSVAWGAQVGDVTLDPASSPSEPGAAAVVWSRTDRPARMIVEWSTTDSFRTPAASSGPPPCPRTTSPPRST